LKAENGVARWGVKLDAANTNEGVTWNYSISKPSVALSKTGNVEVGSKVKVTTLSAGSA
jgi:hypothetical protein